MWPLSSSRSSTLLMSKLGYLASRAPRAMFSRSRKTAMVASDVVIGMVFVRRPRGPRLEPIVVEADAHALGGTGFGATSCLSQLSNRTTCPASAGTVIQERFDARASALRGRRRHEAVEPRILEFQSRRAARHPHVVGAAQGRQRVQMQHVHRAPRHDVHPAIGHRQGPPVEIPIGRRGKRPHVTPSLRSSISKVGETACSR